MSVEKILVVGPSWVGDMVMAQSLFMVLKTRQPDSTIDVLAPAWCEALLTHMPQVRRTIPMTVGHGEFNLGERRRIARELKTEQYDQAIILPNSFKSALVPWLAGIPLRTGWRGEARSWLINDCRRLDKQDYPLMVQRFAALACAAGAALPAPLPRPVLEVVPDTVNVVRRKFDLDMTAAVLVLCPGAEYGPSKKWPAAHYAGVASHWLGRGRQVWILGSENDKADGERIIRGMAQNSHDRVRNFCGRTSLGEAIALMSLAARVVSNDSGLMHVAAALGRPLVVLYGSTSPAFTPPLADDVSVLSLNLACSPCFKRECPLGHTDCLNRLPPARVIESLGDAGQDRRESCEY